MIKIEALVKYFGALKAVDGLAFEVNPGDVLGFLGPNGAGKSTTMKMLTGYLHPDSGYINVAGVDVVQEPALAQQHIGYLPEGAPAYGDMTVEAFLRFIGEARGMSAIACESAIKRVSEQVELHSVLARPIDNLSKGFRRRVGLAQALLHDPQVLILDEPTDGLDPNQKRHVRELIAGLAQDKVVIISTHILEEVMAVCNRVLLIAQGRCRFEGSPAELEALSPHHQAVSLHLPDRDIAADQAQLKTLPDVADVVCEQAQWLTVLPRAGAFVYPQVDQWLREQQITPQSVRVESGRLDEVFTTLTRPAADDVTGDDGQNGGGSGVGEGSDQPDIDQKGIDKKGIDKKGASV
ncbi:hypothetical protein BFW38_04345 [Terasakiispira papahanaumokuakeensis]|uniref:ABC transporter domain-containing protein n=1 Tax=Terasakiispira papahanaumokuakeensis TaxID=197479 RepID=A0A1E2V7D4_9GAMM|nr:ABC transporter ATP-binding protein [Terasakiispira papahanaumokuakeensis]ODC02897.1 hypothetical protein BFW38_04345 [Terasakiispira papahanaumokuakeensis]